MNRRKFLKYASITAGASLVGPGAYGYVKLHPRKTKTRARIVIVGAGTGGLTTAAKLTQWLDGATITIVDGNAKHYYQPGYTLIGCGVYKPEDVVQKNADFIPDNVNWIKEMVAEYDPEANSIITESGKKIPYDFLIVSAGAQMNYSQISGLDEEKIGKNGIGSVYHSPEKAYLTWLEVQRFISTGGVGLFTKPSGRIKCGGAPLKAAFLTESLARETGKRNNFEISYFTRKDYLFKVNEINDLCTKRCGQKEISSNYDHTLVAVDAESKVASFKTKQGINRLNYDYIHITPPMSAPDNVKNSELSCKTGKYSKDGWMEVDKFTMQHKRYANVFGVGDIVGTPIGKTGASIKLQAPTIAENIASIIQGQDPLAHFNGYTSCLLATGIGCASVVEFDYSNTLTPTLPFLNAKNDGLIGWNLKVHAIKPFYYQMIQGRIPV